MDSDSEEEEEDEEEESIESEEVTEVVPVVTKPEPSKEELEDAFLDALLAEQQEEPTFEEDHKVSDMSGIDLGRILQINTKCEKHAKSSEWRKSVSETKNGQRSDRKRRKRLVY